MTSKRRGPRLPTPDRAESLPAGSSTAAQARLGVTHSLPAATGILPMGIAFGVLVVQSGLPWWWATVFAAVVFAGSLEFLLIPMAMASAPLMQIAVTAFLVNFRHVFYALTFPLHRVHGRIARTYSTFTLTDEAWALTAGPEAQMWSRARILAVEATFQVGWIGSVTAGAVGGVLIPDEVKGLHFAVSAFFVVLAVDAFRVVRCLVLPLVAAVCALLAHTMFREDMLVPALLMFTVYVLGRYGLEERKSGPGV